MKLAHFSWISRIFSHENPQIMTDWDFHPYFDTYFSAKNDGETDIFVKAILQG